MICVECGGEIHIGENCKSCNLSYNDMIASIRHDEMRRLFRELAEAMENNDDTNLIESLIAVEFKNSSLLFPAFGSDGKLGVRISTDTLGKNFIHLFTDMEEYEKNPEEDVYLATAPFETIIHFLQDEIEGFVINIESECCVIGREFVEKYYPGRRTNAKSGHKARAPEKGNG